MQDFFKGLFDFDFKTFVTPALIRPLYILGVAFIGVSFVQYLMTFVFGSTFFLLSFLFQKPVAYLFIPALLFLYLLLFRAYAELAFVVFDMNDRLESLGGRRQGE